MAGHRVFGRAELPPTTIVTIHLSSLFLQIHEVASFDSGLASSNFYHLPQAHAPSTPLGTNELELYLVVDVLIPSSGMTLSRWSGGCSIHVFLVPWEWLLEV
jgi:hypothetical protein